MPSKKVFAIFIVCISGVVSAWLISSIPSVKEIQANSKNTGEVVVSPYEKLTEEDLNDDWKKIITDLKGSEQKVQKITQKDGVFDETTLTAKLSRDIMSQYITLKGSGAEITRENLDQITINSLSNPEYLSLSGPRYIESNLKKANESDPNSGKMYKDAMTITIKDGFLKIKEDPYVILANATKASNPNELKNLDPIISAVKTVISNFLNIPVPKKAVSLHLNLLNSLSNLLADLESIRVIFDDPIRSLAGINQYENHKTEFINAINTMSQYLVNN